MNKKNNPPAFPILMEGNIIDVNGVYPHGMSLRDYFAAKALLGFLSNGDHQLLLNLGNKPDNIESMLAKHSFEMADAMLLERNKETK